MKYFVALIALILPSTLNAAIKVVNNCDHDIYVAQMSGKSGETPNNGEYTIIDTKGWTRVFRYQTETFNEGTHIRIQVGQNPLTLTKPADTRVYHGCGHVSDGFDHSIFHKGKYRGSDGQMVNSDPLRTCLFEKRGQWLAFVLGKDVVVEGRNCNPAVKHDRVLYKASSRSGSSFYFYRYFENNREKWRLLDKDGSSNLTPFLGNPENLKEFSAEDGRFKGYEFKIEYDSGDVYQRKEGAGNWSKFAQGGSWLVN